MNNEQDDAWLLLKTVEVLQYMIAYDIMADMAHVLIMRRCRRLLRSFGVQPCTAEGETLLEKKWEKLNAYSRSQGSEAHTAKSTARQPTGATISGSTWFDRLRLGNDCGSVGGAC
jgi:hypothetical protein